MALKTPPRRSNQNVACLFSSKKVEILRSNLGEDPIIEASLPTSVFSPR